jgi:hypothetical protein
VSARAVRHLVRHARLADPENRDEPRITLRENPGLPPSCRARNGPRYPATRAPAGAVSDCACARRCPNLGPCACPAAVALAGSAV